MSLNFAYYFVFSETIEADSLLFDDRYFRIIILDDMASCWWMVPITEQTFFTEVSGLFVFLCLDRATKLAVGMNS